MRTRNQKISRQPEIDKNESRQGKFFNFEERKTPPWSVRMIRLRVLPRRGTKCRCIAPVGDTGAQERKRATKTKIRELNYRAVHEAKRDKKKRE